MSEQSISLRGVTKIYGEGDTAVEALSDITLDIPAGEFVVLLGPSGSGKTTLLNLIGALEAPSSGSLEVFGQQLADLDEDTRTAYRLNTIGFVFQFYNLVPTLTAAENVALLAELTGPDVEERTHDVLDRVGLGKRIDHFPAQLSGGEQQRVAIARGLVKGPELLLCDEPTGSLDVETGKQVLGVLHDIAEETGRTVLIVTHNAVIARMADRVIRLRDGRVIEVTHNDAPVSAEDLEW